MDMEMRNGEMNFLVFNDNSVDFMYLELKTHHFVIAIFGSSLSPMSALSILCIIVFIILLFKSPLSSIRQWELYMAWETDL